MRSLRHDGSESREVETLEERWERRQGERREWGEIRVREEGREERGRKGRKKGECVPPRLQWALETRGLTF